MDRNGDAYICSSLLRFETPFTRDCRRSPMKALLFIPVNPAASLYGGEVGKET